MASESRGHFLTSHFELTAAGLQVPLSPPTTTWANGKNLRESLAHRRRRAERSRSVRSPFPLQQLTHVGGDNSDTTFTCIFCQHDKSVSVRVDRKEGVAQLICKVCDQRFQSKVNRTPPIHLICGSRAHPCCPVDLTEPIDIYSEWIDAADAAEAEAREKDVPRRGGGASTSRGRAAALSDDE